MFNFAIAKLKSSPPTNMKKENKKNAWIGTLSVIILLLILVLIIQKYKFKVDMQEAKDTTSHFTDSLRICLEEKQKEHIDLDDCYNQKDIMCSKVLNDDITIFYLTDKQLQSEYINKTYWGFNHKNTQFYDMSDGAYCEISIWDFNSNLFQRGNYYRLCGRPFNRDYITD